MKFLDRLKRTQERLHSAFLHSDDFMRNQKKISRYFSQKESNSTNFLSEKPRFFKDRVTFGNFEFRDDPGLR